MIKVKKLARLAAPVLALGMFASSASATTGPFYKCLKTSTVNFDGTIVDAAVATPELSTLVDAVSAAGLVDTLASAENITVYAPTNAAFANVPEAVLTEIIGNADALNAVLTYHVTPGMQDPRRWWDAKRRPTLAGQHVFYHWAGGKPRVNQAAVSCQGVKTTNGMVWLIDSVLLPQF